MWIKGYLGYDTNVVFSRCLHEVSDVDVNGASSGKIFMISYIATRALLLHAGLKPSGSLNPSDTKTDCTPDMTLGDWCR